MAKKFVALDKRIWTSKEAEFRQNRDCLDKASNEVAYKLDDLVMVRSKNVKPGQGSNKLRPLYTGLHKIIEKESTGKWFELKAYDKADQTTKKISVDLIKPFYFRKMNDFLDNPLKELTFSEALELDKNYDDGGVKQNELPIVKVDKIEEDILEGEEIQVNQLDEYVTRRGRKTTVRQPYSDGLRLRNI